MIKYLAAGILLWLSTNSAWAQPIRIGVLTDISGVYSDWSGAGSVEAAKMAVEEMAGSVTGRDVTVVSADFQGKPDVAAAIANRWIDTEGVNVIVDVPNSAAALAVQRIAREKGRIAIFSSASSSDLTGSACSPTGFQWTYNTYALSRGVVEATLADGKKRWFFITPDYAAGRAFQRDAAELVRAGGGEVLGNAVHPFPATDLSSFLLTARSSGADIIALANAGQDTMATIKQAREFSIGRDGMQRVVPMVMFITDVNALGLEVAQGLRFVTSFYWNRTPESRRWSQQFFARRNAMPSMAQAGVYSAVRHYLKAVAAAGTTEATAIAARMREMPVSDVFAPEGRVRADGMMIHDMYAVRVKRPAESREPWDYYEIEATIPGSVIFRQDTPSLCPLMQQTQPTSR